MITIISGTNSEESTSLKIARVYHEYLVSKGQVCKLLDLARMPTDFITNDMYANRAPSFEQFQQEYLLPADKFVIIIPEYNGGIPGIFKLMMDASDITKAWWGKKACLTGVAAGRSGNLRGLDTLTNIFHYLKVDVLKYKLPISQAHLLMNGQKEFTHEDTIRLIHEQMNQFIEF